MLGWVVCSGIHVTAILAWGARRVVRCIARSIGIVGHLGEVAIPVGIATKLFISLLHSFIRRLRLHLELPIFIGSGSGSGRSGSRHRHHRVPSISINDIASRFVNLQIGGSRSGREVAIGTAASI
jgi:hypothetical protein